MDDPQNNDPRVERYSTESDSWFIAYCECKSCGCPNQQTKVRVRADDGTVTYWCTYCFMNHREKS